MGRRQEGATVFAHFAAGTRPLFIGQRNILWRARCNNLLEKIGGGVLPEKTLLPPFLVVRQTCGCGNESVRLAYDESRVIIEGDGETRRQKALAAMVTTMMRTARFPERERQLHRFCATLLGLFEADGAGHFQTDLENFITETASVGFDPNQWQPVLNLVQTYQSSQNHMPVQILEERLDIGNALLSERAFRRNLSAHFQQRLQADQFGYMNIQLLSVQTEGQALRAFYDNLAGIGIRRGWVAFYRQGENGNPAEHSLLWIAGEEELTPIELPSHQFPPPQILPPGAAFQLALLPLNYRDEPMGFVVFDTENLDLYGSVMLSLAAALKSARLHEQVLELSLHDSLTGVANRRYFDLVIKREVQHCNRYDRALSLILFDIDNFKMYNDTFGHQAGDEALKKVVEYTRSRVRRQLDTIARYGGDEFIVVLSETDTEDARQIAEEILRLVSNSRAFHCPLTLSMGIATLRGSRAEGELLVRQADIALYQAKHYGRGLVRVYTP